jgi:carboxyl-terminal processing protease
LVKAGLDVAQMWLDGDETLVNTIDRDGNMSPINMINGHAITHDPLVVIVSTNYSYLITLILHFNFVTHDPRVIGSLKWFMSFSEC